MKRKFKHSTNISKGEQPSLISGADNSRKKGFDLLFPLFLLLVKSFGFEALIDNKTDRHEQFIQIKFCH